MFQARADRSVADRVSPDTIRRMNFLTGGTNLRSVTALLAIRGKQYELSIDKAGRILARRVAKNG